MCSSDLGLTRSVSNRTLRPLPSRLACSILSGVLSTQNMALRTTSTARPSGLVKPIGQNRHKSESTALVSLFTLQQSVQLFLSVHLNAKENVFCYIEL